MWRELNRLKIYLSTMVLPPKGWRMPSQAPQLRQKMRQQSLHADGLLVDHATRAMGCHRICWRSKPWPSHYHIRHHTICFQTNSKTSALDNRRGGYDTVRP